MLNFEYRTRLQRGGRSHRIDRRPSIGLLTCLLLLSLNFAGCSIEAKVETTESKKSDNGAETTEVEKELPPVEVVKLSHGSIEAILRFSTNLEAESEVGVVSQAARQVTELGVEEGDRVRRNQVLLRLQDEEQRSELARIESQLAKAQREYQRQQNLFAKELISEQVINESTYEVEQLELALEDAKRNLGYTEVRAPIAGTITGRHVNLGDQITLNQQLFDLVDFDSIVARIYVPEKELGRLRTGQATRVFSNAIGGAARSGEVARIAPIVDPRSGTIKVTVGIPRNQGLLPGMYVEVELVTDTHDDALLVPKRAVVYDKNQAFLYRLREDDTVERLRVEVLLEDRDNILPSEGSGLAAGHRIVVAGQAGLKDGAEVRLARQSDVGETVPTQEQGDATEQADSYGTGAEKDGAEKEASSGAEAES